MTWTDTLELSRKHDAAEVQSSAPANAGQGHRRDTHVTKAQSPVGVGVDAQQPNSMPRAEDDAITRAGSRDVHDQPGSGDDTARRREFFS